MFSIKTKKLTVDGEFVSVVCNSVKDAVQTIRAAGIGKHDALTFVNKASSTWLGRVTYIGDTLLVEVQSLSPEAPHTVGVIAI